MIEKLYEMFYGVLEKIPKYFEYIKTNFGVTDLPSPLVWIKL